jgi:hypothetical protein
MELWLVRSDHPACTISYMPPLSVQRIYKSGSPPNITTLCDLCLEVLQSCDFAEPHTSPRPRCLIRLSEMFDHLLIALLSFRRVTDVATETRILSSPSWGSIGSCALCIDTKNRQFQARPNTPPIGIPNKRKTILDRSVQLKPRVSKPYLESWVWLH